MPTREIKTRFKLEGEQSYRKAMTDAANAIKVLNSEEKLAKAQYEATGDAQQYAADQARILKEQIENQKKAVKAAEDAVAALTKNGVEKNSKEMQAWQTKLNNAKTALAKMETQLNDTEKELVDQNSALGNAKKNMGDAETKVASLTKEEKLAEAQFKATGDQQEYASEKTRILNEKIDAQKAAVAAAETAIKSMTENGVDPNSEEMLKWKDKLVEAKTKLADMETQLNDTEKEIGDQSTVLTDAKKTMGDAETKVASLTKEEKLAEAQFKATGDKQQYASEKTRILKEKIEAQKKAVEAAETAIKSMTEKGIDPNSEEMVKWKDKLVEAKTKLANMETQLDNTEKELSDETTGFGEAKTAATDYQSEIEKVNKGIDFQNTIDSIDNITSHMETAVTWAAKAAKAFWDMGVDAGNWADDLVTAANSAGLNVETYQSWQYASRIIDTSVDDIVKNWKDIDNKMNQTGDSFYEYAGGLAELGVATMDSKNNLRQGKDIFWDIIDALHNMGDESAYAAKASELFGNDWRKLNPLITAGKKAYMDTAEEAKSFAVVSEKNVQALAAVDDETEKLQQSFDTLKYDALAALAPTFKTVAEALNLAIQAMNEFVNSEEGQADLAGLNEALSGLITSFLGEDNGKGTFEAIVTNAKSAVSGFTDALKWLKDNGDATAAIIGGIAGAYATLKVAKSAIEFMQLLKAVPLYKLKTLFGGGNSGGGGGVNIKSSVPSGGSGGSSDDGSGVKAKVSVPVGMLTKFLTSNAVKALGGLGIFSSIAFKTNWTGNNDLYDENGNPTAEALAAGITNRRDEPEQHIDIAEIQKQREAAAAAEEQAKALERAAAAEEYWDKVRDENASDQEIIDAYNKFRETFGDYYEDFDSINEKIENMLVESFGNLEDLPSDLPSEWFTHGENAAIGMANGIDRQANEAIDAARRLAGAVSDAVSQKLMIRSPSRVMESLGAYTSEGFAEGIEANVGAVQRAVGKMVAATSVRPAAAYAGAVTPRITGAAVRNDLPAAGANPDTVHVTLVLDDEILGDVMAPIINGKIGAQINATRRN